ncbi:zinc finger protein 62-like [Oppia nitens]|uniref:zinc finger protein 62-like n=1 Tax=Oppia nitens TaxID=1686743 RepID=UPI0023DC5046|nr:zinc finger protein 62-like [Oppia nitens]
MKDTDGRIDSVEESGREYHDHNLDIPYQGYRKAGHYNPLTKQLKRQSQQVVVKRRPSLWNWLKDWWSTKRMADDWLDDSRTGSSFGSPTTTPTTKTLWLKSIFRRNRNTGSNNNNTSFMSSLDHMYDQPPNIPLPLLEDNDIVADDNDYYNDINQLTDVSVIPVLSANECNNNNNISETIADKNVANNVVINEDNNNNNIQTNKVNNDLSNDNNRDINEDIDCQSNGSETDVYNSCDGLQQQQQSNSSDEEVNDKKKVKQTVKKKKKKRSTDKKEKLLNITECRQPDGTYRCQWTDCMQTFRQLQHFKQHLHRHREGTYRCDYDDDCQYITDSPHLLKAHRLSHIKKTSNKMNKTVIKKTKTKKKKLKKKKSTTAVVIKKRIKSADELKAMELFDTDKCRQPDGRTYRCPWVGCSKLLNSCSAFLKHRHQHLGTFKCPIDSCNFMAQSNSHLKVHQTVHSDDKPYECRDCRKCFSSKQLLHTHRLTKHPDAYPDKPYMNCQETGCTYRTKLLGEFNKHKRGHSLPIVCADCGKRFKSNYLLRYHQTKHQSIRQHKCQVCGKQFKSIKAQTHHYSLHHQQMDYTCDYDGCNETFTIKHLYLKHRKSHVKDNNNPRPHACEWPGCDRRFKSNAEMTYHMNTHSGDIVYRCEWPECNKSFIIKSSYDMHMARHQGKNTYRCSWPECDYSTQNTVRLKSHIMKHKGIVVDDK